MDSILIFIQRREWQIGHLTEHAALDVVAWSTNALSSGKWPTHNHENKLFTPKDGYRYENAGNKLVPDGSRALIILTAPDWKHAKETLGRLERR